MSVYLVSRNFYEGPSGLRVRRHNADTLLDCFRRLWRSSSHVADDCVGSLRERIEEENLPVPETVAELAEYLNDSIYDPEIVFEEHAIQILTDNDEIELAEYFFDDHYRTTVPADRTAFLLHDHWRLPGGAGEGGFVPVVEAAPLLPAGNDEGTTWFLLLMAEETSCLTEMRAPMRIDGVRLPGLCDYLAEIVPAPGEPGGMDWPWELRLLRTQASDWVTGPLDLRTALETTNALNVKRTRRLGGEYADDLHGDFTSARRELAERLTRVEEADTTLVYPSDPSRSLIQAEEHIAQLCLNWVAPKTQYAPEEFYRWILFDDLWASAHPDLANGILRFAWRWDVLSEGEPEEE